MEFFSFIIMIVFAIISNYANDKAELGEKEHIAFNYTVKHLFEKETVHRYEVDDYIKNSIIPNYLHSELYYRIENYQTKEEGCVHSLIITCLISVVSALIFIRADIFSPTIAIIISLVVNAAIYFFVSLLYLHTPIFQKLKLKNYNDLYNIYNSEYHYKYLKSIEESVMFRYFSRKILSGIAMIIFLLNIWSMDI